jgi:hypothetical protein
MADENVAKDEPEKKKPRRRNAKSAVAGDIPGQVCGIVMPISKIDDCGEEHWGEVLRIVSDSIKEAGFRPQLVSYSSASGTIHARIIQNLYDNPLVVCDVSCRNPNVMFELGIRLAFDKPTIIIKDELTPFSFDTGGIEHVPYRRDLRYSATRRFKRELIEKIQATVAEARKDPHYSTFLKHFRKIEAQKLEVKELPLADFLSQSFTGMQNAIDRLEARISRQGVPDAADARSSGLICTDLMLAIDKFASKTGAVLKPFSAYHEDTQRRIFRAVRDHVGRPTSRREFLTHWNAYLRGVPDSS